MFVESIFLSCSKCGQKIRQMKKDLKWVSSRVCPGCGNSVKIVAAADSCLEGQTLIVPSYK